MRLRYGRAPRQSTVSPRNAQRADDNTSSCFQASYAIFTPLDAAYLLVARRDDKSWLQRDGRWATRYFIYVDWLYARAMRMRMGCDFFGHDSHFRQMMIISLPDAERRYIHSCSSHDDITHSRDASKWSLRPLALSPRRLFNDRALSMLSIVDAAPLIYFTGHTTLAYRRRRDMMSKPPAPLPCMKS